METIGATAKKVLQPYLIPFAFVCIGVLLFFYGKLGLPDGTKWQSIIVELGKTILASGIFAGILKLMQFSGVFKEELEKIIFEPKYIKEKNNLPVYWDKLTQELFHNKFPLINKKILDDIKDHYLPTKEATYYDNYEQFLDIQLIDGILVINQKSTFNIICSEQNKKEAYEYQHSMSKSDDFICIIKSIKVNGKLCSNHKHRPFTEGKKIINKYKIDLKGSAIYKIEREEEKRYPILLDNLLTFRTAKLTNSMSITVNHSVNLDVTFRKMGLLKDYIEKSNTQSLKQYEHKGIIYKQQGYFIELREKILT